MQEDPIVSEIRQVRQAHAERFHFDLDAIFADIKEEERRSGATFVRFPSRRLESAESVHEGTKRG